MSKADEIELSHTPIDLSKTASMHNPGPKANNTQ
jgi:hypothetical protein